MAVYTTSQIQEEILMDHYLPPEIVTLPKIQIRTETEIITVKVTFLIYDDGSIGCECEKVCR